MLLKIDQKSAAQFNLINEVGGDLFNDHRRYYTAGGKRLAILVLRNGLDLHRITGQVVDAALGWDEAGQQFAQPEDIGKRRSKITCYRIVLNAHSHGPMGRIRSLSSILKNAPRRTS